MNAQLILVTCVTLLRYSVTLDLYANHILKEHVFENLKKVINRHACVLKNKPAFSMIL